MPTKKRVTFTPHVRKLMEEKATARRLRKLKR